jgi:hypothetical protein
MKFLLGYLNAKIGMEDIFNPTVGNENFPHVCGVFFYVFNICLNSIANGLCVPGLYIPSCVPVVVWRQGLALSFASN